MNYLKLALMVKDAGITMPVLAELLKQNPARAEEIYSDCRNIMHEKLESRLLAVRDDK